MVVRLEGKIDGRDVIFRNVEGDLWETTVPFDIDGTYVCELSAYDEAGNEGFTTKILITFHPENQSICIEPFPWKSQLQKSDIISDISLGNYIADLQGGVFVAVCDGLWRTETCENKDC